MASPSPSSSHPPSPTISREPSTASDADVIQIFIKSVAGSTTPFSLPRSTTVADLKRLVPIPPAASASTDPQTLRLIHAGHTLSTPTATLASLSLPADATIHLALPLRGGGPRRPRCSFKDCKEKVQPIVGDCGFCQGRFCSRHRMLESHACAGMEECKDEARKANTAKLEGERTRPQAAV